MDNSCEGSINDNSTGCWFTLCRREFRRLVTAMYFLIAMDFGEAAISTPTAELGAPVLEEGHREDDERVLHPLRVEHPMGRRTAVEDRAGSSRAHVTQPKPCLTISRGEGVQPLASRTAVGWGEGLNCPRSLPYPLPSSIIKSPHRRENRWYCGLVKAAGTHRLDPLPSKPRSSGCWLEEKGLNSPCNAPS